jgi:hypothetical protein
MNLQESAIKMAKEIDETILVLQRARLVVESKFLRAAKVYDHSKTLMKEEEYRILMQQGVGYSEMIKMLRRIEKIGTIKAKTMLKDLVIQGIIKKEGVDHTKEVKYYWYGDTRMDSQFL